MPSSNVESNNGLATITAIAAVGNPRSGPGKKIVLDVQIYVGSPNCESLLGALSYFNGTDMSFGNGDVALYLIYATIAKYDKSMFDAHSGFPHSSTKYDLTGDILWIVPLTPPCEDSDSSSFIIDPAQRALVHLSGAASNCHKENGTFDMDIDQYVSTLCGNKDSSKTAKVVKPSIPFSCIIPDSPRYKLGKPVPYNKRYVSTYGFLTDVIYEPGSETVQRFQIFVANTAFLGQQGNTSTAIPNTLDSPSSKTPRSGKGLISYGNRSRVPNTPTTPTPVPTQSRKRQRVESDDGVQAESEAQVFGRYSDKQEQGAVPATVAGSS